MLVGVVPCNHQSTGALNTARLGVTLGTFPCENHVLKWGYSERDVFHQLDMRYGCVWKWAIQYSKMDLSLKIVWNGDELVDLGIRCFHTTSNGAVTFKVCFNWVWSSNLLVMLENSNWRKGLLHNFEEHPQTCHQEKDSQTGRNRLSCEWGAPHRLICWIK